ncbi:MAG: DUF4331 family protein [Polyangiaceae bacterium]|nr:DUF4331 family protein [Polyangiaceae bacterium]
MKILNIAGLVMLASSLALVGCGDDDDGGGGGKAGTSGSAGTAGSGGSAAGGSGGTGNAGSGGTAGTGNAGTGGTGGSAGSAGTAGTGGTGGGFPAAPTLGAQIDRMGRPAVSTALIQPLGDNPAKDAAKDDFNSKTPADAASFVPEIKASLGYYDALDTMCGNQAFFVASGGSYDALAGVLAADFLRVNSSKGSCNVYLAVESGTFPDECGGRTLTMDVIDSSYTALSGATPGVVTDGIAVDADGNQTATFPFLAPSAN